MLHTFFSKIAIGIVAIATLFTGANINQSTVGATIPTVVAVFSTSLQDSITTSATSMTLVSGTDKAGNALSGYICYNIDEGTSLEEFVCGTTTGTAVASLIRGIDPVDGDLEVTALKKAHRRGASVKVTNYPVEGILARIINGTETLPNKLSYNSHPTFSSNTELIDKKYADDLIAAGAPDASTTVKGLAEEATQAEVDARTAAGGTSARLFVNPTTVRANLYHDYAADAGANDSYTVTVTPAPTAYTTGDEYTFKANTVNTGAATLNVNGLGAKSLKMNKDLDPVDGYIKAGADVKVVYDGTNMQIVSVSGKPAISQNGSEIYAVDAVGTDAYAITLTPAISAYTSGLTVAFKAGTANTDGATLAINGLAAKAIVKNYNSALVTGDILQNQIVEVVYDSVGDNFQMTSPVATSITYASGRDTKSTADASTTQNIAHGLGKIPKKVKLTFQFGNTTGDFEGYLVYNGTTSTTVGAVVANGASRDMNSAGNIKLYGTASGSETEFQTGVVTFDATNIIITWTKTNSPTGSWTILWEAEG